MASILRRLRADGASNRGGAWDVFTHQGQPYLLGGLGSEPEQTMRGSRQEPAPRNFEGSVSRLHRRNGVISGAVTARALLVSQLVFRWRSEIDGAMFGNASLGVLERPGPLTRQQLLWRVEQDICYAGNAYVRRLPDGTLRRLRPDWVSIVLASDESPEDVARGADCYPLGYVYRPSEDSPAMVLGLGEVAHLAPEPDPTAHFRGESWVSAVVREILTDLQATDHLDAYFENAATANMIIKPPQNVATKQQFDEWVEAFDSGLRGPAGKWRNIYLGGGADAMVVGSSLADLDLKNLQGGLESRVSVRSRVPAVILGIREGLAGSSLNSGNYGATRRMWADGWFHGYAQSLCASFERIVARPLSAELTFDPGRVLFLQEDAKDAADIMQTQANALQALDSAGYQADAAVTALANGNIAALLGGHDGLQSVQRQPLDSGGPTSE